MKNSTNFESDVRFKKIKVIIRLDMQVLLESWFKKDGKVVKNFHFQKKNYKNFKNKYL